MNNKHEHRENKILDPGQIRSSALGRASPLLLAVAVITELLLLLSLDHININKGMPAFTILIEDSSAKIHEHERLSLTSPQRTTVYNALSLPFSPRLIRLPVIRLRLSTCSRERSTDDHINIYYIQSQLVILHWILRTFVSCRSSILI